MTTAMKGLRPRAASPLQIVFDHDRGRRGASVANTEVAVVWDRRWLPGAADGAIGRQCTSGPPKVSRCQRPRSSAVDCPSLKTGCR